MRRALALAAAIVLLGAGCGGDAAEGGDGARLVVSAASSMTEALRSCAPDFEEAENADVRLAFAGSDELAAQIRQGARVDVYAAANTSLPAELHGESLLSEPVEFATNELVLAVPAGSEVRSVEDVALPGTEVVVASESVPIGSYTRESLAKLPPEQAGAILDNVVSNEPDVKGIVGKLTQGAGDAGFVYLTDVKATGGDLEAIELPDELEPDVAYAIAVVEGAENPGAAREFIDGLGSAEGTRALEGAGFRAPPAG